MNKFTKLIRDLLADRLEQIDAGNSNIDEESAIAIFKAVSDSTDMTKRRTYYRFQRKESVNEGYK